MGFPDLDQPFVTGTVTTSLGVVPQSTSDLTWADILGSWKARWGIGRMRYTVQPGLYAVGTPDPHSPVLVTANYKMSFDRLRKSLKGRSAWILVLDTKGINVWCAAGKGTFGTDELLESIRSSGLSKLVDHHRIILPQLGAPGMAAHKVHRECGFKPVFGPVMAEDLPKFLDSGMKATPEMRIKTFPLRERLTLVPIELVAAVKAGFLPILALVLAGGLGGKDPYFVNVLQHGLFVAAAFLSAIFSGSVLTPILLPWIPGRAFSTKGLILGLMNALAVLALIGRGWETWAHRLEYLAVFLLILSTVCYLSMNFTGASTFTSLSGVRKEMRWS
ncbi:MAG: acetyl-CoA synthase subunit gamma, partial [Syntrophobacteraceae bacterium]|nr:acetyl-CoA synthase subunit gamma [Syntrophobacteraceae bacterium]